MRCELLGSEALDPAAWRPGSAPLLGESALDQLREDERDFVPRIRRHPE